MRDDYHSSLSSYSDSQWRELESIRHEVGWAETMDHDHNFVIKPIEPDMDGDGEWIDEGDDEFRTLSLSIVRKLGVSNYSQSWAERLARERHSWEQDMDNLYDAYLAFSQTGAPPATPTSDTSRTFTMVCINLTST
ncbi:hypothetical protein FRC08_018650 [Ceratobasidium sp. 394]|nr:hypothetical protein FRC08_018650 [Ceratobasidium sp. 394]